MTKNLILFGFCLATLLQSCEHGQEWPQHCADGAVSSADAIWSHGEGDLQNSKKIPSLRRKGCLTGPKVMPSLQWAIPIGGEGTGGSPVIGPDGTIFVAAEHPSVAPLDTGIHNGGLYSIAPTGQVNWFFSRPLNFGQVQSFYYTTSVSIGIDGTIYFTWYDGYMYALDQNGSLKWSYRIDQDLSDTQGRFGLVSPPTIGDNNRIYASADTIFCFSNSGQIRWRYFEPTATAPFVAMAIGRNGIYCVSSNQILSLDLDGNKIWSKTTPYIHFYYRYLLLDQQENLFFQSGIYGETIHSVDKNGIERWSVSIPHIGLLTAAVLRGNYLYLVNWDSLERITLDSGNLSTIATTCTAGAGSPLFVDDTGTIYVGGIQTSTGNPSNIISARSSEGEFLWDFILEDLTGFAARPGLSKDGSIYFISNSTFVLNPDQSMIYAIK